MSKGIAINWTSCGNDFFVLANFLNVQGQISVNYTCNRKISVHFFSGELLRNNTADCNEMPLRSTLYTKQSTAMAEGVIFQYGVTSPTVANLHMLMNTCLMFH